MPLSDDERRRLEKLEQDLAAAGPDLKWRPDPAERGRPRSMVS